MGLGRLTVALHAGAQSIFCVRALTDKELYLHAFVPRS